jgi:hypothetical protein
VSSATCQVSSGGRGTVEGRRATGEEGEGIWNAKYSKRRENRERKLLDGGGAQCHVSSVKWWTQDVGEWTTAEMRGVRFWVWRREESRD